MLTQGGERVSLPPLKRVVMLGLALVLALSCVLLPSSGSAGQVMAWTLPGRAPAKDAGTTAGTGSAVTGANGTAGRIQEVAPPAAVQQLNGALAARQPRLTILEPADGAMLPDGPWTLRLQVEDWPLVDAGPLGLGPHLLLQLDDDLPTPLLETTLTLPALSPGSHRLTVMAARPSGEVLKRPGAFQQIRLHRVAPNPLSLPAPGSPQLLPASPRGASTGEPVLIDWLLIDAPLQHLRADDARWRLRVSVNGDSFLVDQQTPLWLKGWRPGSNAVLLELVDGRGEPLNPPFNSYVREVVLRGGGSRPAWLGGRLSEADLARLLGEVSPANAAAPLRAAPEVPAAANSETSAAVPPKPAPEPAAAGPADSEPTAEAPVLPTAPGGSEPAAAAAATPLSPSTATPMPSAANAPLEGSSGIPPEPAGGSPQPSAMPPAPATAAGEARPSSSEEDAAPAPGPAPAAAVPAPLIPPARLSVSPSSPAQTTAPRPFPVAAKPTAPEAAPQAPLELPPQAPPGSPRSASADPSTLSTAQAPLSPAEAGDPGEASPRRSAREEVNADGTMIRPPKRGPLEVLRERLQR